MTTGHTSRRRFLQASGVAAVTALAGCGGGGGDGGGGSNVDHTYSLAGETHEETIEISVGDTVLWESEMGPHRVNLREKPEASDWSPPTATAISGEQTHRHTFEVTGTYVWDCDTHPGPYTIEVVE